MIERLEIVADQTHSRMRLEDVLLRQFGSFSKMYLRELVKTAACEVNGRHENIGYRIRPNDLIEITVDRTRGTAMRPEAIDIPVLYEDDSVIVVNKPAGMLAHPSHRENSGTLLNALVHHVNKHGVSSMNGVVRPGLIHRLDKQTSGIMVIAKNAVAHRRLSAAFMKKSVEKLYVALVEGVLNVDEGTIEAPIGRFAELKNWGVKEDGKHAETRFAVRQRFDTTTLLELEPITGRTNQLRIHCETIGHPIVGDVSRGGRDFERLCLHAFLLGFPHPVTNERMVFSDDHFVFPGP